MSHLPATALRDNDLLDFATEVGSSRKTSVIIEARRAPVPAGRHGGRSPASEPRDLLPGPPPASRAGHARDAVKTALASTMRELEGVLQKLGLAASARRNDLSGSFVVEVTPRQLRELATTPAVQAIRCNRRHRRSVA
ncbi:hypothetical protein [Eleftheria terrae]|uniref:hypothetical protein n=1 Tax=Eleftheria terrae TaxID=1597781 RepID=UPI00263A8825|nr:hypothetical protein [Eleftheria terrae]WKB53548.1 hypothetical protein N7L95_03875 [Eleftheria terrae]